jgi:hypothetical protein
MGQGHRYLRQRRRLPRPGIKLGPATAQSLSLRGRAAPEAISTQHFGDCFATHSGSQ